MSSHWVPSHGSVVCVDIGFRTRPGTGTCSTRLQPGQTLLQKLVFHGRQLIFCPPPPLGLQVGDLGAYQKLETYRLADPACRLTERDSRGLFPLSCFQTILPDEDRSG